MYHTILFDLDGTLTDPGIGITNSVAYALEKYGIVVEDRSQLYRFIGPPLRDSFIEYYGFSKEQAKEAVAYYRAYYEVKGIYENSLYDGVIELLQKLKDCGKRLLVATSKPEEFTVRILKHFQIYDFFSFIAAATMNGTREQKADIIAYALEQGNITDKSATLMVGDRKYDIQGAKQNGLDALGVLFGYGSRKELETAGADILVEQVADIYTACVHKSEG